MTQLSTLRLLTTRAVLAPYNAPPLTNHQAREYYEALLSDWRITFLTESPDLDAQWKGLAGVPAASPKLWMDAYLAAFAISGGHSLVTFDAGFSQFRGLDLELLS